MLPGYLVFEVPFGRSLVEDGTIQLDSDWSGIGGLLPSESGKLARNSTNVMRFVAEQTARVNDETAGVAGQYSLEES